MSINNIRISGRGHKDLWEGGISHGVCGRGGTIKGGWRAVGYSGGASGREPVARLERLSSRVHCLLRKHIA